jgi:DNA-binding CsgD family transcriptional regulator
MAAKLYQNKEWLKKRFYLDRKTPEQIAQECGVSLKTIYNHLNKFGLKK